MARFARVVAPGYPHHITQRGNRRQPVFFRNEDYQLYLRLMSEWCAKHSVEIWAYCLMPNHVHLIAVPGSSEGLCKAVGEAHRRYSLHINKREGWTGHLWQDRFASFPMEERYLLAAARYIEMNPVNAGIVSEPQHYEWSSAKAHLTGTDDSLVKVSGLRNIVSNWTEFLSSASPLDGQGDIERHISTGRPMGGDAFCRKIAGVVGVPADSLIVHKPGPKKKPKLEAQIDRSSDVIL